VVSGHPRSVLRIPPGAGTFKKSFCFKRFAWLVLHGAAYKPAPHIQIKKTLDTAQNPENKGPGIFLPPRSMVPKVVTGKILETLELRAGFPEGSKHSARDPSQCWTKSGASGRRHIPGCVVSTRARLSAAQF
jgi:hypothetical protein